LLIKKLEKLKKIGKRFINAFHLKVGNEINVYSSCVLNRARHVSGRDAYCHPVSHCALDV